jgi:hypothetical protein
MYICYIVIDNKKLLALLDLTKVAEYGWRSRSEIKSHSNAYSALALGPNAVKPQSRGRLDQRTPSQVRVRHLN